MIKVINQNSKIDLTKHDCAFIEMVIDYAEKDPRWKTLNHLGSLLNKIPVFLVNKEEMEKKKLPDYLKEINLIEKIFNENNSNEKTPPIELLGCYTWLKNNGIQHIPAIFLCPENIKILCKPKNNEEYQLILAEVVIHELAHAKMDDEEQYNYLQNNENREFFDSIEEPFANWFALKYFYYLGNGYFFGFIKGQIEKAPVYYKHAIDLYDKGIDEELWLKWKENKKKIMQDDNIQQNGVKHYQDIENLKELLNL